MNNQYKFYVYFKDVKIFDSLNDAITALKNVVSQKYNYVCLGVQKNQMYSCDLILKEGQDYRISNDYKSSTFKNDALITVNTIEILKREFKL